MSKLSWFLFGYLVGTLTLSAYNFVTGIRWVDAQKDIIQDGWRGRLYGVTAVERVYMVKSRVNTNRLQLTCGTKKTQLRMSTNGR